MKSRATFLGHPIHQMLVDFPIGAFAFSVASDTLHTVVEKRRFADAASQALSFGLLSAAVAIPFGLVDYLAIGEKTRARRVGLWHAVGNAAVLGLFGASRWLRSGGEAPATAKWLSGTGFMLLGATAWAGGELVNRHAVGVHADAREDAPGLLAADGTGNDKAFPEEDVTLPGISPSPGQRPAALSGAGATLEHSDRARRGGA